MLRETPDKVFFSLLCAVLIAILLVVAANRLQRDPQGKGFDKTMEKAVASQARVALLQKLYGPVEQLRKEGQLQAALLKLDEIGRSYPGEAHGSMVQGEILLEMGAFDEAVASFVRAVKANGDYVDAKSPLSGRDRIETVVKKGLASSSSGASPLLRKNLFYLQSRLAGGCE